MANEPPVKMIPNYYSPLSDLLAEIDESGIDAPLLDPLCDGASR